MTDVLMKADEIGSERHPRLKDTSISYGTAGFRTKSEELDHVMFRTGLLAALRSKNLHATIGLVVTASHNPECDNGVKVVDPRGEMLDVSWEMYATELANTQENLAPALRSIIEREVINMKDEASVVIARDTRSSGKALSQSAIDGAEVLGATVTDYGLLTTPQLHYIVRCTNDPNYGLASEEGYFTKLQNAFVALNKRTDCWNYPCRLTVDCANGIGASKLQYLASQFSQRNTPITINVCNDGSTGELNHECGADYVKVKQTSPKGWSVLKVLPEGENPGTCIVKLEYVMHSLQFYGIAAEPGKSFASLDGDADRIVYFYFDRDMKFHLLDGDKIATLIASYLLDLIKKSELPLNLGIVQTAYANGSSTAYMRDALGVEVACTSTGVKHLHHRAQQFDVGVYFEANGHGTVLFSEDTMKLLDTSRTANGLTDDQKTAITTLCNVINLINQTVGDAISDLLLVETILQATDQSLPQWDHMYSDLPNRQLKVKVKNRHVMTTTDADRKVVTPDGLQNRIDELVARYHSSRASGTEDVVRVYAEANSEENADNLARDVARLVHSLAGGVGAPP